MVYDLTRGMTGKPKQWIGTRSGMYMHGEKSIQQQIKSSWLCGQCWSNPSLLVTKAAKSNGFPNWFRFAFGNRFSLERTKNHSFLKVETSA